MPQFSVYRNRNPKTKADIPYLLDVQTDLLSDLATRTVVPLYLKRASGVKSFIRLTPEFTIEGRKCVLMTPELAGIPVKALGEPISELGGHRIEIVAALDLLITGF